MTNIALEKQPPRRKALEARAGVAPPAREAAARSLAARGLELTRELLPPGDAVALYFPMREEIDCLPLLTALDAAGFVTALPATVGKARPLIFRRWRPGQTLKTTTLGTSEPTDDAPEISPDLIFVPLAAFDARGHRLGYGAGHYDATLRHMRALRRIVAAGLAFEIQQVDHLPSEPYDQNLDFVLTEDRLFDFRKI